MTWPTARTAVTTPSEGASSAVATMWSGWTRASCSIAVMKPSRMSVGIGLPVRAVDWAIEPDLLRLEPPDNNVLELRQGKTSKDLVLPT